MGYPLSYVELIGTVFGLVSVYFASKANILTWPTGLVNEAFLFILFFQVHLYADMFLQIYFLVVTLYGWWRWRIPARQNKISTIPLKPRLTIASVIIVSSLMTGYLIKNIHLYLPNYFTTEAAYPFTDSLVMIL